MCSCRDCGGGRPLVVRLCFTAPVLLPPSRPRSKLCLKNRHGEDIFQVTERPVHPIQCFLQLNCWLIFGTGTARTSSRSVAAVYRQLLLQKSPCQLLALGRAIICASAILRHCPPARLHANRASHRPTTTAGGGQRLLGVPPLPRLLWRRLHRVLQLRALPQGGEWRWTGLALGGRAGGCAVCECKVGLGCRYGLAPAGLAVGRAVGCGRASRLPAPLPLAHSLPHSTLSLTNSPHCACVSQAGLTATGQLINEARRLGFDNVHDFLVSFFK